jgi:hypothetical protein
MILTNCFDVANEYEWEGGAAPVREDRIVVGNNRADRMGVVDRNIVDQLALNAPRADKAAVDVAGVVDAVADVAALVSWLAEIQSDRRVNQRFVKMGHARVVVVVLDPSSR